MDLTRQFAFPRGLGGALVGALMARMNAAQIMSCVADLAPAPGEHVLELGFGPGIGLAALAEAHPDLRIAGADPSSAMGAAARRRIRRHAARVELREATAASLPWPDATFDAACATNNAQLWQPLDASLTELRRVLRPGGRLALSVHERAVLPAGGNAGPHYDAVLIPALTAAGFTAIRPTWHPSRGMRALNVMAVNPAE